MDEKIELLRIDSLRARTYLLLESLNREVQLAEIVALLQSPAKNVISALQSGGNTIHGVLKTLGERPEA